MEENKSVLPLGIMKQASMKLDSFITDIRECMEEDGISDEDRAAFEQIVEMACTMNAAIINIASKEIDEEDFLQEQIEMDAFDPFPGTEVTEDIMNETI